MSAYLPYEEEVDRAEDFDLPETELPEWYEASGTNPSGDPALDLLEYQAQRSRQEARVKGALSGLYGPVAKVAAQAGLDGLGKLSPDAAGRKLREAGRLLESLPGAVQGDAFRYLRAQATSSLKRAWGDWRAVEEFVRDHLPEPLGDRSPYTEDGLRNIDVESLEAPAFLVEGLIPSGELALLTGDSGTGKSWLVAALGCSVAFGDPWLDRPVLETGHVRYFLPEGRVGFPPRLASWLVKHGYLTAGAQRSDLAAVLAGRISITDGHTTLADPRLEEHLRADIEANGTRLVVFDTLNRSLGDEQSENDTDDAKKVVNLLHRLADDTGATFLLVHHPPHGEKRERGARVWRDAADCRFLIYGSDKDAREGRPLTLWNVKQRNTEAAGDVGYRLRRSVFEFDGETRNTLIVDTAISRPIPLDERIRLFVQSNPGASQRLVTDAVEGRAEEIRAEISRLLAAGRLEDQGKGRAYKLYDVPEAWPAEAADEFTSSDGPPDLSDLCGEEADDADR